MKISENFENFMVYSGIFRPKSPLVYFKSLRVVSSGQHPETPSPKLIKVNLNYGKPTFEGANDVN